MGSEKSIRVELAGIVTAGVIAGITSLLVVFISGMTIQKQEHISRVETNFERFLKNYGNEDIVTTKLSQIADSERQNFWAEFRYTQKVFAIHDDTIAMEKLMSSYYKMIEKCGSSYFDSNQDSDSDFKSLHKEFVKNLISLYWRDVKEYPSVAVDSLKIVQRC